MATFTSNSPEETAALGGRFAATARPGAVFALQGDLGAGKTQFVRGFLTALGSPEPATSPTFTLVHEYAGGRLPVYHFDFYRLPDAAALMQIGFDDYIFGEGVSLVEWADKFPEAMPTGAWWLRFAITGESARTITEDR